LTRYLLPPKALEPEAKTSRIVCDRQKKDVATRLRVWQERRGKRSLELHWKSIGDKLQHDLFRTVSETLNLSKTPADL
jgi:hypothetical protein